MPTRAKERDDLAREKKRHLQSKATKDKARAILEQGKSIDKLTLSDLNALLEWHGVKMPQKLKKEDKLERWRQILAEGGKQSPAVRG